MEAIYYVYEHWRMDRNEPFYVGRGKGRRAWLFTSRNRFHKAVIAELTSIGLCAEVRLIVDELTADQSNQIEIDRIAFWRSLGINLANITGGGSGILNPSDDLRQRLSEISKARIRTFEWKARIAASVTNPSPETIAKRIAKLKGLIRSEEFREKMRRAKKNPPKETRDRNRDAAKRSWENPEWRANQIAVRTGKVRITDGVRNAFVKSLEPIPDGWRRGMMKRRGWHKRASSNGLSDNISTRVFAEELES